MQRPPALPCLTGLLEVQLFTYAYDINTISYGRTQKYKEKVAKTRGYSLVSSQYQTLVVIYKFLMCRSSGFLSTEAFEDSNEW